MKPALLIHDFGKCLILAVTFEKLDGVVHHLDGLRIVDRCRDRTAQQERRHNDCS